MKKKIDFPGIAAMELFLQVSESLKNMQTKVRN
jgi:hypothetical protein